MGQKKRGQCPVRDKILVEKRLKSHQRAVRYAIWAKNKFNTGTYGTLFCARKSVSTNIASLRDAATKSAPIRVIRVIRVPLIPLLWRGVRRTGW